MNIKQLCVDLSEWGADVKSALERVIDDEELYAECLSDLICDKEFELLDSDIKNKTFEDTFSHLHALKGVVGNMGLTPLYNVVSDMTESFRAGDYSNYEEQYVRIQKEKETFFKIMEKNKN
ncbi:MAG: Hpt domain-containing protein [Synergistaceae bacterium]